MKKLFYYLSRLFSMRFNGGLIKVDEHKVVYLVLGYYLNDDEFDICAVCDDCNLSEDFANDLRKLGKYHSVSNVDYTLNQLNIY